MREQHRLQLPFRARGVSGTVSVRVHVVEEPSEVGFDLLPLSFDVGSVRGFPTCTATPAVALDGYAGLFGVQFLVTTPVGGKAVRELDVLPFNAGGGSALLYFGVTPTFFDAPANPDRGDESWEATTLLVSCPDVAVSRQLSTHAAFRWGYDLVDGAPVVRPPAACPVEVAADFQDVLAGVCPGWQLTGR